MFILKKIFFKKMYQPKSNSNQTDSRVDPYSNFLRIVSTVMHYTLFGFESFDENIFELFTKHGLGKVEKA